MDKSNTPLEKLTLQYEAFNRTEGKSEKTVSWYNHVLWRLSDYLKENGYSTELKDLNLELIRTYILHLQKRQRYDRHPYIPQQEGGLSPVTIENYVRSLRAFFNWLYREGYTEESILERLKPPKCPKKLVEPLNDVEIAAIFSAMDAQTSAGARDVCMATLMLDTGLRSNEVVTFKEKDLHLEQGYLKVMGKGQKERMVPFGSASQKSLMKYMFHFRAEPAHGGIDGFFLTLEGQPLSNNALQMVMKRLGERSGVSRLHAHLLRHTFAVNYLVNGGDVFTLQQILGHTTLDMVRRYVNLANTHVMTQHKRFSPVDRMNLRQINRAVTVQKRTRVGRKGS
ncbi:MAG: tyrosine-type recombinase/integrase [Dehalococcoidia bacterium]